jgi:hypothetical protein
MDIVDEVIDQPRIKRVKYSGIHLYSQSILTCIDASIQKRIPLHSSGPGSPTPPKTPGRTDGERGFCIYLTRQTSLPNIVERIEKLLEDGKNSRYFVLCLKFTVVGMEL